MIIKKVTEEHFDIYQICEGMFLYDYNFRKKEPGIKCFECERKFQDDEPMNLAQVRNKVNVLLCDDCKEHARKCVDVNIFKGNYAKEKQ